MKRSIFIIFLSIFFLQTQMEAQRWERDETLASTTGRNGFFVSPLVEYSDLDGKWNTSIGGGLAFIAGDFFVGAYGLGMVEEDWLDSDFEQLDMGHGGFWIGYVKPQHKAVHLFTSVKAGWGALDIELDDGFDYEDTFFAVTPEVGLEVNVFRWLRIGATVGYRWLNGLDESPNFDRDRLEGATAGLTFRIGGFGRERNRNW